jgi:hypothetical protein
MLRRDAGGEKRTGSNRTELPIPLFWSEARLVIRAASEIRFVIPRRLRIALRELSPIANSCESVARGNQSATAHVIKTIKTECDVIGNSHGIRPSQMPPVHKSYFAITTFSLRDYAKLMVCVCV